MNLTLLILAAGIGSRYGKLKQIDPIGPSGETIMDYSIYDAIKAGFNKVIFVIQKSFENDFKEKILLKYKDIVEVDYIFQKLNTINELENYTTSRKKPWGTAHAVLMAKEIINEPFAVINADDFYGSTSYKTMTNFLKKLDNKNNRIYTLLSYKLENTLSKHGTVSRGICQIDNKGYLISLTEHKKIKFDANQIFSFHNNKPKELLEKNTPTSMNFIGFTPSIFKHLMYYFDIFLEKNKNDLKTEFFLPNFLSDIINDSKGKVKVLSGNEKWFGVTYYNDKKWVKENIRTKIINGKYPKNLFK